MSAEPGHDGYACTVVLTTDGVEVCLCDDIYQDGCVTTTTPVVTPSTINYISPATVIGYIDCPTGLYPSSYEDDAVCVAEDPCTDAGTTLWSGIHCSVTTTTTSVVDGPLPPYHNSLPMTGMSGSSTALLCVLAFSAITSGTGLHMVGKRGHDSR